LYSSQGDRLIGITWVCFPVKYIQLGHKTKLLQRTTQISRLTGMQQNLHLRMEQNLNFQAQQAGLAYLQQNSLDMHLFHGYHKSGYLGGCVQTSGTSCPNMDYKTLKCMSLSQKQKHRIIINSTQKQKVGVCSRQKITSVQFSVRFCKKLRFSDTKLTAVSVLFLFQFPHCVWFNVYALY